MTKCAWLNDPNYAATGPWSFCPSIGADYLFTLLFGAVAVAHIAQAIIYKKVYSLVIIIAAAWQTAAFAFRADSILNPWETNPYSAWFILILTGPLWINAYVYMCMGRMVSRREISLPLVPLLTMIQVYNFIPDKRLCRVKAWRFGLLFVLLDITAFLVQLAGASIAAGASSGTSANTKTALLGLHVYMGGVSHLSTFLLRLSIHIATTNKRPCTDRPSRPFHIGLLLSRNPIPPPTQPPA